MQQKLTLRMDDSIIRQAKSFAHNHKVSLSQIVSDYFKFIAISGSEQASTKRTPVLKELTGIIKSEKSNNDLIDTYKAHVTEKYL